MDKKQALKLLKVLAEAYPRQELREGTITVYAGFIGDLDYRLAERVITEHIKTSKWFPAISEIRARAAEIAHGVRGLDDSMELLRRCARANDYETIKKNPLLQKAVAMVGWTNLTTSELPEPLYRRIADAYTRLRDKLITEKTIAPGLGVKQIEGGKP